MKLTDRRQQTIEQAEKTQAIRIVVDVLILPPLMIGAATNKHLHPLIRIGLAVGGIGTLFYNGYNFYTNLLLKQEAEKLMKK